MDSIKSRWTAHLPTYKAGAGAEMVCSERGAEQTKNMTTRKTQALTMITQMAIRNSYTDINYLLALIEDALGFS